MIDVSLKVNGFQVSSFDDIEVDLELYSLANMARLTFSEKTSQDLKTAKAIIASQAEAVVYFDKQPVISGYIYEPAPEFSEHGAGLTVIVTSPIVKYIGRAVVHGKTYYNQKASDIIADLCPDIEIEARSNKILPKFVTYGYETIDGVLQKFCRKTDSVIYSGAYGQLIIDERSAYSETSATIATGKNVLSVGRVETNDDAIVIIGQLPLEDNISLEAAICTKISSGGAKKRLFYGDDITPAAISALKPWSKRVPFSIPSWMDNSGNLLEINKWYQATDAWHDLNEPMRLYSLHFRLNKKDGFAADLGLEV